MRQHQFRSFSTKQSGFTLVELVVVIVILGILSATALPKFINVTTDAREAAIKGLAGGLRSAVSVVQARHFASGGTATTVTMADTTTVRVTAATGVPTGAANGIGQAMQSLDGFTPNYDNPNSVRFRLDGAGAACQIIYDERTGRVTIPTNLNCT